MTYKNLQLEFREILKNNSLKMTKQREIILEVIFSYRGHFIPETLHIEVQKKYPDLKIGIATIYRTLQLLESEQIVTSISFGANGKKYEYGRKDHHDHMVCNSCGVLIEFYDDIIEKQQERIAKKSGFKIKSHSMQIYGICKKCQ
jgi:Fur family ferric uptake transcriptional regulator